MSAVRLGPVTRTNLARGPAARPQRRAISAQAAGRCSANWAPGRPPRRPAAGSTSSVRGRRRRRSRTSRCRPAARRRRSARREAGRCRAGVQSASTQLDPLRRQSRRQLPAHSGPSNAPSDGHGAVSINSASRCRASAIERQRIGLAENGLQLLGEAFGQGLAVGASPRPDFRHGRGRHRRAPGQADADALQNGVAAGHGGFA